MAQQVSICFDTVNHSHDTTNAMTSEIWMKDNLWRKILGEILKEFFITVET